MKKDFFSVGIEITSPNNVTECAFENFPSYEEAKDAIRDKVAREIHANRREGYKIYKYIKGYEVRQGLYLIMWNAVKSKKDYKRYYVRIPQI